MVLVPAYYREYDIGHTNITNHAKKHVFFEEHFRS